MRFCETLGRVMAMAGQLICANAGKQLMRSKSSMWTAWRMFSRNEAHPLATAMAKTGFG